MPPLFGSTEPQSLPEELCWHIAKPLDYAGQALFLCGKPVSLITHRVGRRTWPCLYQWPKLGRECPHCDRRKRSTTWVPLLTCNVPHRKLIIMGGEKTWVSVKALEVNRLVEFHMAKVIRVTPVFTKHMLPVGLGIMKSVAERIGPDGGDITRWLLHYWQWPDLTKWYGEVYRESLRVRSHRERAEVHGMDPLFGAA